MTNLGNPSGVQLWNASILLRGIQDRGEAESRKRVFASPAFRLIEAGTDVPPTVESLVHLLQLASKTATALSECNDDRAQSVLMSAAEYESLMKNLKEDDQGTPSKESATAQYYCGRMDAAWKDGNESVAFFMFEQATDERRLDIIPVPDVEEILDRAVEIGKALLRKSWGKESEGNVTTSASTQGAANTADGKTALVAVKWLQKTFQVLERVGHDDRSNLRSLREALLRSLARAYFASSNAVESNLERAEATINELIQGKNATSLDVNLLWMKLAVLKRALVRVKALTDLSAVFYLILDKLDFQEMNVMSFLREPQIVIESNPSVDLAVGTTQELLNKALDSPDGIGHSFVDTIAMSLLLLVKSLQHSDARSAAEKACQSIARRMDFSMEKTSAAACQLVLWRNGEASYKAKKWIEAADWFVLSASPAFQSMAGAQSRCIRKAALCYIQQGEYARASTLVSRCSQDESGKAILTASGASNPLHTTPSGLEEEAIQAVENMLGSSDFDRKTLLLATQLAHETKQKTLLLAVLEAMYKTLQREPHVDVETEGIILVRCSIRILLDLLKEPLAATFQLVESLKNHFQRALDLVNVMASRDNLAVIAKDLSWLWRTAYNAAVTGCQDWEELVVAEIFDLSRELMEAYSTTLAAAQDMEVKECMVLSSFSATSGRLFVARRLGSAPPAWSEDGCPTDVLYGALEAMLCSSLRSKNISIDKFSRWLRALCTILLARNRQQDRASALSFIEQAVEVIKDNKDESGDQMYAHDEREWLLHIAFNTGVERFAVLDIQEAKRWIETATVLAGLVHNSNAASEKVCPVVLTYWASEIEPYDL
ncbi:hypothetical protein FRC11_009432 [Ceratobasidium sp. 423]|nr:hypothetical protein FRC11_009432 [Ceratobasidium sp. 423]